MATTTLPALNYSSPMVTTVNGVTYYAIVDPTTKVATWAQTDNPNASNYYSASQIRTGQSAYSLGASNKSLNFGDTTTPTTTTTPVAPTTTTTTTATATPTTTTAAATPVAPIPAATLSSPQVTTVNGTTYFNIIDPTTKQPVYAQYDNPSASNYYSASQIKTGQSQFGQAVTAQQNLAADQLAAQQAAAAQAAYQAQQAAQQAAQAQADQLAAQQAAQAQAAYQAQQAAAAQAQAQADAENAARVAADQAARQQQDQLLAQQRAAEQAATQAEADRQYQAQLAKQQADAAAYAQTQAEAQARQAADAAAKQAQLQQYSDYAASKGGTMVDGIAYIPNPDPASIQGTTINGQNMININAPGYRGYATSDQIQSGIANAAQTAHSLAMSEAAKGTDPFSRVFGGLAAIAAIATGAALIAGLGEAGTAAAALGETEASMAAADAMQLAAQGLSQESIAATLSESYGIDAAAANEMAGAAATTVAETGVTPEVLASQGVDSAAIQSGASNLPEVIANTPTAVAPEVAATTAAPVVPEVAAPLTELNAAQTAELMQNVSPEFVNSLAPTAEAAATESAVAPEVLEMANATADPIAALNAAQGWTTADLGYLASIGAPAALIEAAAANGGVAGTAAAAPVATETAVAPTTVAADTSQMIPTVDAAGNPGFYDPATGAVYDSTGQLISESVVPEVGTGTTLAEATQAGETGVATDAGTSAVAPVEAAPTTPAAVEPVTPEPVGSSATAPDNIDVGGGFNPAEVPVVDATPTWVNPTPTPDPTLGQALSDYAGAIGSTPITVGDLAMVAGAGALAGGLLTPEQPSAPGYGPIGPINWGKFGAPSITGINAGYLTAPGAIQPQYHGTPTQANYYWGTRPLITDQSQLGTWNTAIPSQNTFTGAAYAQGAGPNKLDVNKFIQQTITPQQYYAAQGTAPQYAGPIAPATGYVGSPVKS